MIDVIDPVLIVDHGRSIRELIAGYLEKNGMRASLAANGRHMLNARPLTLHGEARRRRDEEFA